MAEVNIKGVDKVELLKLLWENSKLASVFGNYFPIDLSTFDYEAAKEAVKESIDYFRGRAIKCDLSKDTVDPWLYDRDYGEGKFQEIVNQLLKQIIFCIKLLEILLCINKLNLVFLKNLVLLCLLKYYNLKI